MSLKKYANEVVREGKRVRWPKADELIPAIIVVIAIAAFAAAVLAIEDIGAGKILGALEEVFKTFKN